MDTPRVTRVLVTVVAAVMVLSVLSAFYDNPQNVQDQSASNQAQVTATGVAQYSPSASSEPLSAAKVLELLSENNIPGKYAYLPNLAFDSSGTAIDPSYDRSPAPMGVADLGYSTNSGIDTKYSYSTGGFLGSFMFEGLDPFYQMNSDPGTVAIQMNSVLDHVTIQGDSSYVFWIQNVMLFTPSEGTIQFVSNIWSLSTPSMEFPENAILSGGGSVAAGLFYYYAGPVLTGLPAAFTVIVYSDSVMNGLNNAVDFAYEVTNTESGSTVARTTYDMVTFNSVSLGATVPAAQAKFVVDGNRETPSGLLYDSELVVTGPGGGSTSTIYSANNQFKLQYKNSAGTYTNIPAAFNYGVNTGETIQGLSVWWTSTSNPIAHLSSGPSILVPLWGSDVSRSGGTNLVGTIDPPNAFVFFNMGTTYDSSKAAWAPINPNGTYTFAMPGGVDYSGAVMMSDFQPFIFDSTLFAEEETNETEDGGPPADAGSGGGGGGENETTPYLNISLTLDTSQGIYTPLYATGNSQVPFLTLGFAMTSGQVGAENYTGFIEGSGTSSDPYMIENQQYKPIDELFTRTNGYMFPSFSGIMLKDTDAYMQINNEPAFAVKYPSYMSGILAAHGIPWFNTLNFVFYNTSNVALANTSTITGWFANTLSGFPAASVMFWDSTNFLVANNNFKTMGNGLLIYNSNGASANGTVWGNHFVPDLITMSSYAPQLLNGTNPVGLIMLSNGNLVYNNYFGIDKSVYSPAFDIYANAPASYSNSWDLGAKQPLTYEKTVMGYVLTGSIVETNYQGGNYWINLDSIRPYTDNGSIVMGGDSYPLEVMEYAVTFTGNGLPPGTEWSVTLGTDTKSTTGTEIVFSEMNGTYSYHVGKPTSYQATPLTGMVAVYGEGYSTAITFSLIQYQLTFTQTGNPAGSQWSVDLSGDVKSTTGNSVTYMLPNGTYDYTISGHEYYKANPASGTALVNGADTTKNVNFVMNHFQVTFTASGMPENSEWGISMGGASVSSSTNALQLAVMNGTYYYSVISPDGYMPVGGDGSVIVYGNTVNVEIQFTERTYAVTFNVVGLPSGSLWGLDFNGAPANTTSSSISFQMVDGNYSYNVTQVDGYTAGISSSYVVVDGQSVSVNIQYSQNPDNVRTAGLLTGGAAAGIGAGIGLAYLFWRKPT